MSFELPPTCRAKSDKVFSGNGLIILATLISPLLAVCLTQYLRVQEKHYTTFALPVQDAAPSLPAAPYPEARLEPSNASPRDHVQPWQAFAPQPEKQASARKLLGKANEMKGDPASQLMLLRAAKDIATQASDGQAAFQAIDTMAETSDVDANTMKMAVLTRFASAAQGPAQHKFVAEEALRLVDQAVGQEHFMVASQLGKLALAEAKRAVDRELLAQAQGRIADVAERVKARERHSR